MKVTNFGPGGLPITLAGWSTGITSLNSNVEIIGGGLAALNFVQRITSNTSNTLLNPIVNFASGSNIAFSVQSNTLTITGAAGGGGAAAVISAGSNSTAVQEISTAGASTTLWSPFDHAHAGVQAITSSSSNTLQKGIVNLRPGSGIAIGLTDTDGDGEFDTATFSTTSQPAGGGGSAATHMYPLDQYTLDATYGDDFTGSSLAAKWTRRNFTSGAETYQLAPTGSFMRIAMTGRAIGDGYFQTAPSGDWTFMMSWVTRWWGNPNTCWGIACINSVGTGLATKVATITNAAFIIGGVTTYTTYSGSFQNNPEETRLTVHAWDQIKTWAYLRKSGTNYYAAYSLSGETWGKETPAFSSSITVDRIGMFLHPQSAMTTGAEIDVDLFNKIA